MIPRLHHWLSATALISLLPAVSLAQTNATWNGTSINGNWSDPTKWSTNPVFPNNGQPSAGDTYNAIIINSGVVTLDQNITIQGLTYNQTNITGAGNLTLNGASTWIHGTMTGTGTTTFNGPLLISPTNFNPGLNRTFINNSTTTWAGSINLTSTGTWNNQSGSILDAQTNTNWNGGTINNLAGATLRKSAGVGTTTLNAVFNNAGLVEVNSGTLAISTGSTTGSGAFTIASGSTLRFTSSYTIDAGASINGAGSVLATGGTTTVNGTFAATGDITLNNGAMVFNTPVSISSLSMLGSGTTALQGGGNVAVSGATTWTQGNMSGTGTTTFNGPVTLNNPSFTLALNRTVNSNSTTTWINGSSGLTGTGVWNNQNGALFDLQNNAQWNGAIFNNLTGALLRKSAGAGTSTFVGSVVNNSGTIQSQSGTLAFNGGFTQSSGSTILAGGGISSTVNMNFAGGNLTGTGILGASAIFGNAAISPGASAGTLTITGNLTLSAASVLNFELGTVSDLLNVNGNLTLDGILNVTSLAGFNEGTFTLIDYVGTLTDNGLTLGIMPGGFTYELLNNTGNSSIDLRVISAVPEPATWLFGGTALFMVAACIWRKNKPTTQCHRRS